MRLRKIHAVVAVSVALVLVARSIDARRRPHELPGPEPLGEAPHGLPTLDRVIADSPAAEMSTLEVNAVTPPEPAAPVPDLVAVEPAAPVAELIAVEPAAPEAPEAESDMPGTKRWLPRGPVAVAATAMVVIAVLAGAIAAAVFGGLID